MRGWADSYAGWLQRRPWLTVFLSTLAIYLLTAAYLSGHNSDTVVAVWPAYAFTHTGTFRLDHVQALLPHATGFIHVDSHVVAARSVGVLLTALPVQLLLGWTGAAPEALGAVTSSLVTAAAVATMFLLLRQLAPPRLALAACAVLAFGTAFWTIAAAELWTHGPDALWLSLGLLATSRRRFWLAGAAFAPAVFTRPHLALAVAVIGLACVWETRSVRTLLAYAVPGAVSIAALLLWNDWYYGVPSLGGSYVGDVQLAVSGGSSQIPSLPENLLGTAFSPWCGLFLFTPVVAVGLLSLPRNTLAAPLWSRAATAGTALYLLGQFRISNFDGGGLQYGNRYMIEPLMLFLPLALFAYQRWALGSRWKRTTAATLAATSVGIYGVGAFLTPFWRGIRGDWVAWYPYVVVHTAGLAGIVLACSFAGAVVVTALLTWRATDMRLDQEDLTELATI